MKIDILTLFPSMYDGFLNNSILKRAIDKKIVDVNVINFRDYTPLKNGQVDDTIYGGGPGMLLRCEPVFECIDKIKTPDSYIVLLTPDGVLFNQKQANMLKDIKHLILICGHYEGFDERIRSLADLELSIGDFILTGGECASMCIVDAVTRLIPGVINEDSLSSESFNNDLLDYPMYTKPASYRNMDVPEVLLSGNHKKIAEWRKQKQKEKTKEKRPDLVK